MCMINIHHLDWSMVSYIKQSLLLLWENAVVSVVTHTERELDTI